jgi:hypothetical protein
MSVPLRLNQAEQFHNLKIEKSNELVDSTNDIILKKENLQKEIIKHYLDSNISRTAGTTSSALSSIFAIAALATSIISPVSGPLGITALVFVLSGGSIGAGVFVGERILKYSRERVNSLKKFDLFCL